MHDSRRIAASRPPSTWRGRCVTAPPLPLQAMQRLVRRVAGENAELKPEAAIALMQIVADMTGSAINFAAGIASRRAGTAKEIRTADLAVYLERTWWAAMVDCVRAA